MYNIMFNNSNSWPFVLSAGVTISRCMVPVKVRGRIYFIVYFPVLTFPAAILVYKVISVLNAWMDTRISRVQAALHVTAIGMEAWVKCVINHLTSVLVRLVHFTSVSKSLPSCPPLHAEKKAENCSHPTYSVCCHQSHLNPWVKSHHPSLLLHCLSLCLSGSASLVFSFRHPC